MGVYCLLFFVLVFCFVLVFGRLYVCMYVKGKKFINQIITSILPYLTLLYYPSSSACPSLSLSVDVDVLYYTTLYYI